MIDFTLKADDQSLYIYVWHKDEDKPRYMIHLINMSCTCMGYTIRQKCKHLDEVKRRMEVAKDKLKEIIVLED